MAALSGKVIEHVLVAQCCQKNRQFRAEYGQNHCAQYRHKLLPFVRGKLAWNHMSAIQLRTYSKINRRIINCNAASSTIAIPSVDKSAFLKLQNGSDIRGVAVDGVEGEPVTLTEPVTEAIAAAFAAWLIETKKPDASKRFRVSIGHDSRISSQMLQETTREKGRSESYRWSTSLSFF